MCFPPQQRALFRYRNFQKFQKLFETVSCSHFSVANVLCATAACTFSRPELPKVARDRQFLTLLTSECASRHNAVHFFDISTSKSAPRPLVFNTFHLETCFAPQWPAFFNIISSSKIAPTTVCFAHFDFDVCFSPQSHALFVHLNCQKCSEHGVL